VKKFPHLVQMHRRLADQGFVAVSVSTNSADERDEALKFLRKQGAVFPNYRLSESNEKIDPKLKAKYPTDLQPILFVFNRVGEKVLEDANRLTPAQVEEKVKLLLADKN
jgi:hypothetical protein